MDSINLLMRARGMVAAGKLADACEIARSACSADKGNADGWLLLGNIYGQMQAYEDAIPAFRQALECRPDDPGIWYSLGVLYGLSRDYRESERCLRHSIKLQPENALAHHGLGGVLQAQGRLEEAIGCYRDSLRCNRDLFKVHNDLGVACQLSGRLGEAADCYREVLRLCPDNSLAWYNLGCVFREQKELGEAESCLRKAVGINPEYPEAHNTLGLVLQEKGSRSEAMEEYRRSLEIRPGFVDALINLGSALLVENLPEDAQECLDAAVYADSENARAHCLLGNARRARGDIEGAYASYRKALSIDPACEEAVTRIARIYERRGQYDEALSVLQPNLGQAAGPGVLNAFAAISGHFDLQDNAIEMLEQSLGKVGAAEQRMGMHFSLGRLYDGKGEYDLAFRNYKAGNELKHVRFNLPGYIHYADALKAIYQNETISRLAHADVHERQPVFIVGMPRSGTSLVEQILSVHADVQATGELNTFNRFTARMQGKPQVSAYPDAVSLLSQADVDNLAREYLAALPGEGKGKPFFTDKMPQNFLHLGLIQQVFPNARVIHCSRDARDTCFSCYSYDFMGDHPYAYDLKNLGDYYNVYLKIMDHWRRVLDIPVYDLEYERLISDRELEIRRLLKFCGLEWDDRCMEFHKSSRIVNTASHQQVRQPLYSSSVGRWKNYERHIRPLLQALNCPW